MSTAAEIIGGRYKRLENWSTCPICKVHDYMSIHQCGPSWEVRYAEYDEDDSMIIYSDTSENAAVHFVDNGDYEGGGYDIAVRRAYSDDEWKTYHVRGEMNITFYAEEKRGDET